MTVGEALDACYIGISILISTYFREILTVHVESVLDWNHDKSFPIIKTETNCKVKKVGESPPGLPLVEMVELVFVLLGKLLLFLTLFENSGKFGTAKLVVRITFEFAE